MGERRVRPVEAWPGGRSARPARRAVAVTRRASTQTTSGSTDPTTERRVHPGDNGFGGEVRGEARAPRSAPWCRPGRPGGAGLRPRSASWAGAEGAPMPGGLARADRPSQRPRLDGEHLEVVVELQHSTPLPTARAWLATTLGPSRTSTVSAPRRTAMPPAGIGGRGPSRSTGARRPGSSCRPGS